MPDTRHLEVPVLTGIFSGDLCDKCGHGQTAANVDLAEGVGFEPTREREPPGGFQDRCLKPLGHPSKP